MVLSTKHVAGELGSSPFLGTILILAGGRDSGIGTGPVSLLSVPDASDDLTKKHTGPLNLFWFSVNH